jgi:hypothetical protein
VLRASAVAERAGVASVSVISTGFLQQAALISRNLGLPDMAIAEYPGVPMNDSLEEFRRKVEEHIYPAIVDGLMKSSASRKSEGIVNEPEDREIVYCGSFDEVQEHFHANCWSDGLPIVPPTIERVERFLRFTTRDPQEVIGSLPLAHRKLTVWNVAVNGVMAGCRPEYMPILLAAAEVLVDPKFKAEDCGSTPGWEPMLTLSGPLGRELGFNSGQGALRIGRQANSSVGRFVRMIVRNVAGFTISPEGLDKATIGMNFQIALAENEDACVQMGWTTYGQDRGFSIDDSVVTIQSVLIVSPPTYSAGDKPEEHAMLLADVLGDRTAGYWAGVAMAYSNYHPIIVLGPAIAKIFAVNGWTKDMLRDYLYKNCRMKAKTAEGYAWAGGVTGFDMNRYAREGLLPPAYGESTDPDRLVPVFQRPEWIQIVVAGDNGRNQSKGYINNHLQGVPTSRKVTLPPDWKVMLAASRPASAN